MWSNILQASMISLSVLDLLFFIAREFILYLCRHLIGENYLFGHYRHYCYIVSPLVGISRRHWFLKSRLDATDLFEMSSAFILRHLYRAHVDYMRHRNEEWMKVWVHITDLQRGHTAQMLHDRCRRHNIIVHQYSVSLISSLMSIYDRESRAPPRVSKFLSSAGLDFNSGHCTPRPSFN